MMIKLCVLCVIVVFFVVKTTSAPLTGTVYYNQNNQFWFLPGKIDSSAGVAFGEFNDTIQLTGWGTLNIATSSKFDDTLQMYAAGYLEGILTAERIYQQYINLNEAFFGQNKTAPPQIQTWFDKQQSWVLEMIAKNTSDFWTGTSLITNQFLGLLDGFKIALNSNANLSLPLPWGLQMLNGIGDIFDLAEMFNPTDWSKLTKEQLLATITARGHCSALFKILDDFSELYASHSSWFTYQATNRIYKHYFFDLNSPIVASKKVSFSSYPGMLSSLDDFYITDSGLVIIETTNGIFNQSLYEHVQPESLLAWQRVRQANMVSKSAAEWPSIFSEYNSGTYNNQYMVLDTALFKPGSPLPDNTFIVVEQIPGLVVSGDLTWSLQLGYWPSYNVPYFEEIYNLSGWAQYENKYGSDLSWSLAPRAKIFRRDHPHVHDLESMKTLMRSNNYTKDPFSEGDPGNAICSRFDLEKSNPSAGGCYDTKVTSVSLARNMISYAISGPTDYDGLPVFSWTGQFANYSHLGIPTAFNFSFVEMKPLYDVWFGDF